MARARQFQEAFHISKNRAKNALTGSRSCALAGRGTRAHFRCCLLLCENRFGSTERATLPVLGRRDFLAKAGRDFSLPMSETRCG